MSNENEELNIYSIKAGDHLTNSTSDICEPTNF